MVKEKASEVSLGDGDVAVATHVENKELVVSSVDGSSVDRESEKSIVKTLKHFTVTAMTHYHISDISIFDAMTKLSKLCANC